MTRVMEGVRIPEVAQHTFVPSAGAILADRGIVGGWLTGSLEPPSNQPRKS